MKTYREKLLNLGTGIKLFKMNIMLFLPATFLLLHLLVCSACITDGENATSVCDESADRIAVCSERGLTTVPQDINCATVTLDLSMNAITVLLDKVFRNLSSVTSLSLVANALEEINPEAFAGLSSLLELDLSNNRLAQWPDFADACNTLRILNLESNLLSGATNELECLMSLEDLGLRSNGLDSFPNISAVGDTIERLELDSNYHLEIKEADLMPFKAIEYFGVRDNLFLTSCSVFDVLNSTVLEARVTNTEITELEDCNFRYKATEMWFHKIAHISLLGESCVLATEIVLVKGVLATIDDDAFDNCAAIEKLDFWQNALTKFPKLTGMKETLTILSLTTNQIIEIKTEWLNELTKLERLDLKKTKLSSFPNVPGPSQPWPWPATHSLHFPNWTPSVQALNTWTCQKTAALQHCLRATLQVIK